MKYNEQRKLLFDYEAKHEPGSPFDSDRAKKIQQFRKDLPIGFDVTIETTGHRHPMNGKLVLIGEPLQLNDENSDPLFSVNGNQFKLSEITSWCLIKE